MKSHFDDSWKHWIWTNVAAGNDKNGIFKILLDEGFDYHAIKAQMNYEPDIPPFMIPNPLKQTTNSAPKSQGQKRLPATPPRFLANSKKLAEEKVEMYLVEDFLNAHECQTLIEMITSQLRPSTLSSAESDPEFRTSQTCDLSQLNHPLVAQIDQRICRYLGIAESYSEGIQGQFYQLGQEFKPHTDYFEAHELETHGAQMGQRTFTFMIYLNDVEEGGETTFSQLQLAFRPQLGCALIWNNLDAEGRPNYHSLHHATPVTNGTKAVITKWFRQKSYLPSPPPMDNKTLNEFIPNYTKTGLCKRVLPTTLFNEITDFYQQRKSRIVDEHVPGDFISSNNNNQRASSLLNLNDSLKQKIHDTLKPMLQQWTQTELEPTYVYGIRVYHKGAALKTHRDRIETHIISVIINVEQICHDPWPLVIEDNWYRQHRILLQPGEMVFYEGGRLLHGRPVPFNGEEYANIFCHFKPANYSPPVP